jgi:hypothetical protein
MDHSAATPQALPGSAPADREPPQPFRVWTAAWGTLRSDYWRSIRAMFVLVALLLTPGFVLDQLGSRIQVVKWFFLAQYLVTPALVGGGASFILRTVRGERPSFWTIFDGFRRWRSVTGAILLALLPIVLLNLAFLVSKPPIAATLGMMVVVYPLIFWWLLRTGFTCFGVMESDEPAAVVAFKRGWELTRGHTGGLLRPGLISVAAMLVAPLAVLIVAYMLKLFLPISMFTMGVGLAIGGCPAACLGCFVLAHAYEHLRARGGLASTRAPEASAATPPGA